VITCQLSTVNYHGTHGASMWKVCIAPAKGLPGEDTMYCLLLEEGQVTARHFCDDPVLASLKAAYSPGVMRSHFSSVLGLDAVVGDPRITPVRYWPGERCTLRYQVPTTEGSSIYYGKVYRTGGKRIAVGSSALYDNGRRVPDMPAIPRTVAHWPDLGMVLQEGLEGNNVGALLSERPSAGDFVQRWAATIGRQMAAIHRCGPVPARRVTSEWHILRIRKHCAETVPVLGRAPGNAGGRLLNAVACLSQDMQGLGEPDPVPSHGGFRLNKYELRGDNLVLLDWDTLCLASPELDAGSMLADLTILGMRHPRLVAVIDQAEHDFLAGYAERGSVLHPRWLAAYRQLWLLKAIERNFRGLELRRNMGNITRLLDQIEALSEHRE
jgi:hypothetical protein